MSFVSKKLALLKITSGIAGIINFRVEKTIIAAGIAKNREVLKFTSPF